MSDDDAWLRSWFDEQDGDARDRAADDDPEMPGSQDWRHGSPPPRRSRSWRSRPTLLLACAAMLAAGIVAARTAAGDLASSDATAATPAPASSSTPTDDTPALRRDDPPEPRFVDGIDPRAAVAELAVHEHVTTGDGLRWVDAARTVRMTAPTGLDALADSVVLVDAVVLDGPPGDATATDSTTADPPGWVARRRARYVVPLRCATTCEPASTPWPVTADPPAGEGPPPAAASADGALQVAGYHDARIESTTQLHAGLDELTVVGRVPDGAGEERVLLWVVTDAEGVTVVGMP